MSFTIYGGKTLNGVVIDDMIYDNDDVVYRNDRAKGYFARFTRALLGENDEYDEQKGIVSPAIAFFREEEPFEPIYAIKLPGNRADYTEGPWDDTNDKFGEALKEAWIGFIKWMKL